MFAMEKGDLRRASYAGAWSRSNLNLRYRRNGSAERGRPLTCRTSSSPVHRTAQGPDPHGQPAAQPLLLARGDGSRNGAGSAQIGLHRLGQLGTDQVAQGVTGEITKQAFKSVPTDLQVA